VCKEDVGFGFEIKVVLMKTEGVEVGDIIQSIERIKWLRVASDGRRFVSFLCNVWWLDRCVIKGDQCGLEVT
jgi:hypothetical protein